MKKPFRRCDHVHRWLATSLGVAALLACGDHTDAAGPASPARIVVTPSFAILPIGGAEHFTAAVLDSTGAAVTGITPTFSVSDTSMLSVDVNGIVTSRGPVGIGAIIASVGGISARVEIDVEDVTHPDGVLAASDSTPGFLWGVAVSAEGTVYSTDLFGRLFRADLPATTVTQAATGLAGAPFDVAFTSDGTRAYVTNVPTGEVSEFDVATGALLRSLAGFADTPLAVAITHDGATLYVSSGDALLHVIDAATLTRRGTIALGDNANGAANVLLINRKGDRLYASGLESGELPEVDLATGTVLRRVIVDGRAQGIALSPDDNTLYVAKEFARELQAINLASGDRRSVSLPDGGVTAGPFGVAMSPDATQIYVTNGTLLNVVDRRTLVVELSLTLSSAVNSHLRRVAFSHDGTTAVITDESGELHFVR
ncbi:MAG TPA: YncE family protein [Gemmatimonadaceae bacterium]|nr:YncE family protein [Gemmatimonadaceae bacterium]